VAQNKVRILILNDFPERGWVFSRIFNSKGYSADSLTYPQNVIDRIKKERPDLFILDLNFSEASIFRTLQKIRDSNSSLPIFIYSNSVTEQFKNQATKLGGFLFSPKIDVEQMLVRFKKIFSKEKEMESTTQCISRRSKESKERR
jgi:DNA-binding NtrC family response regulator